MHACLDVIYTSYSVSVYHTIHTCVYNNWWVKNLERFFFLHETLRWVLGEGWRGGGPQRGDHRQVNSRLGQGCQPTHLDHRSPIGCPPRRRADWTARRWLCPLCRCYRSPFHAEHGQWPRWGGCSSMPWQWNDRGTMTADRVCRTLKRDVEASMTMGDAN